MLFLYVWIFVQIILEALPVSSSGHVALVANYLQPYGIHVGFPIWIIDFLLHGPTIIILLIFFFKKWWQMSTQMPFEFSSFFSETLWRSIFKTFLFVGIADGITFLFWWKKIEPLCSLGVGFLITALTLYSLRYTSDGKDEFHWNYSHALCLGLVQGISLSPGISRFATTYATGCFLGYKRKDSFALSFLIQFPLLIGAFIKGVIACKNYCFEIEKILDFKLLFAMLFAIVISYMMLIIVQMLIEKKRLWYLSFYMVVPIMLLVMF